MFISKINQWWKDLSLSKKLYSLVGLMAILIVSELLTLAFTIEVLSAVRGLVGGEALWSKAQKNALIEIQNYIFFKDEKYYEAFLENLKVPLGDKKTRIELGQPVLNFEKAQEGFLEGKNHPDDIPAMIKLIRRFHKVSYLERSIVAWTEAEALMEKLIILGDDIHKTIQSNRRITVAQQREMLREISEINGQLTVLEDKFSFSLGDASRWLEHTLLFALLLVVLTIESTSLFLTFKLSQNFSRSLKEMNDVAKKIGAGDFSHTIPVRSRDELGQLAMSLNKMALDLQEISGEKSQAEEASQIKSLFLANMSHEIRTPMGAILGFIDLLKDANTTEAERKQYLETISRAGEALVTIINDILDISKVEAGKVEINREAFSLNSLMVDLKLLLKLRSDDKGIGLLFKPMGEMPDIIFADPLRLRQILLNIIGNAIKFTDYGGVTVSYGVDDRSFLYFSVMDTGLGISNEQTAKLFKPFSQVDLSIRKFHGGTGLGLTLSKKLAQLMSGDVVLERTALSAGSTFVFRVPLEIPPTDIAMRSREQERSRPRVARTSHGVLENRRILLVEDVPDNQVLIGHFLSKAGAEVQVAENGLEGLHKALAENFDLVLMDMQMPVLDGYSATLELRQRGYGKPIIALTAHAMKEDLKKCLQVGCDDILTKPVKRDMLIEMISKHCEKTTEIS